MMSEIPSQSSALTLALEKALPEKVFYPGSDTYNASQSSLFVAQQSQLKPICIVRPTTSEDVSTFVKLFVAFNANKSTMRLAIRGGGHSTVVGSSNIDQGFTLDMRAMNNIELQEDKRIVSAGAGAVWGDVYSTLDPLNLSVLGGHGYDVGVAGFILGGGISPFSPRYGFSCDMVENFEVVLANGDIVSANASENTDLWVALKGGLNNLGIVVRFDLRTFQQSKIWGGYIVTPMTTLDANLSALLGLGDSWDPHAAVEQSFTFSAGRGITIVNNMEFTDNVEEPDILAPFATIKPAYRNTMRLGSLSEVAKENQQLHTIGIRQMFCTTSFYLDLEHLKAVCNIFQELLPAVKEIDGMRWTLTYRRLHSDMASKAIASGGNSVGLGTPAQSLIVCVLTSSWTDVSGDDQMHVATQKFIKNVDELSQKSGLFYPFKYVNYAGTFQDPIEGLAPGTKKTLQSASEKYDPDHFFQTVVPGGFKLFK